MEIIFRDKYKIQNLTNEINLNESLDGIAYTADIQLTETEELKYLGLARGDTIKIYDYEFQSNNYKKIFDGIVWSKNRSRKNKSVSIKCKERTVYLEESSDQFLFSEGQTASQRAKQICNEWNIPIGDFIDTKIGLSKILSKSESLFSIMNKGLKETVQKGGEMYKYRMEEYLNLIQIGCNNKIWKLESISEDIEDEESLQGIVTKVKVLGKSEKEDTLASVLGTFSKDTETYGTIQKIIQDEKIKNYSDAKNKANAMFCNGEESKKIQCEKDINTIRAGDKISIDNSYFYVTNIEHRLGCNGSMSITAMTLDQTRRKFYCGNF